MLHQIRLYWEAAFRYFFLSKKEKRKMKLKRMNVTISLRIGWRTFNYFLHLIIISIRKIAQNEGVRTITRWCIISEIFFLCSDGETLNWEVEGMKNVFDAKYDKKIIYKILKGNPIHLYDWIIFNFFRFFIGSTIILHVLYYIIFLFWLILSNWKFSRHRYEMIRNFLNFYLKFLVLRWTDLFKNVSYFFRKKMINLKFKLKY